MPVFACIVYATIFYANWKHLQVSQKIFAVLLVALTIFYIFDDCIIFQDARTYPALILIDAFMGPFLMCTSFFFVNSQLQTKKYVWKRMTVFLILPIICSIFANLNYFIYGREQLVACANLVVHSDFSDFIFYPLSVAGILCYLIIVFGGYLFIIGYTVYKIKWFETEAEKFVADSYSKVIPMRRQLIMFLCMLVISLCSTLFLLFIDSEHYIMYAEIFGFFMTYIIIHTCRSIHHGYKPIAMEGEEMQVSGKEISFLEDEFEYDTKEAYVVEQQNESNSIPEQQPVAAIVNEEEAAKTEENGSEAITTDANTTQTEPIGEEKPVIGRPVSAVAKSIKDYVAASDIAERLEKLMNEEKFYMQQDVTIKDLANAIRTNHSYLSVYLNRVLHLSFSEYINKLRIERAVIPYMEQHPDVTTKEIVLVGNFAHRTTFYRAFQNVTGMGFKEYRTALKEGTL